MKHHFADSLLRDHGHWQMTPNISRHRFTLPADTAGLNGITILTLGKSNQNWRCALSLPNLTELTLHDPSAEQIAALPEFASLQRLRITHARPANLDALAGLAHVKELILEYVSGFSDLSPIAQMPSLRALHLENLRRVRDFSPLRHARHLKYLGICGTFDWAQPIESLAFLTDMPQLEVLSLAGGKVQLIESDSFAAALVGLPNLKQIKIMPNMLALADYAKIEAGLPAVTGARFQPVSAWGYTDLPLPALDIRNKLPLELLQKNHPEVLVDHMGQRSYYPPEALIFSFLGKNTRSIAATAKTAAEKVAAAHLAYNALLQAAQVGA